MIAQGLGFTRHFLKECRISDYDRLKKMACGIKEQARARVIHELSGLGVASRPASALLRGGAPLPGSAPNRLQDQPGQWRQGQLD